MIWIKDIFSSFREARTRKMQTWQVWVDSDIYLRMPYRIFRRRENWIEWGRMQTSVISRFSAHWPETHTYLWYKTMEGMPLSYLLELHEYEETLPMEHGTREFLFPDSGDRRILERVLEVGTLFHLSRAVFVLETKPAEWQPAVLRLVAIVRELNEGHSPVEFEELASCRCLCYSADEDLVIAKVDMSKDLILGILEAVAQENGLKLEIQKGSP